MEINGYRKSDYDKSTGTYECSTAFESSRTTNKENDNSFTSANDIVFGNSFTGQISINDNYDTYKFILPETGNIAVDMTSYMPYYCIKVFDSAGEEVWYTDNNYWNDSVKYRSDSYEMYLEKGTYYVEINGYRKSDYDKSTGKYDCSLSFASSDTSFEGDDNSFDTAKNLSWNRSYTGQISINDNYDNYKFSVPANKSIAIDITSYMRYYCIIIRDSDGKDVWYTDNNEWNSNVNYRKDVHNITLSAGTYYMEINGYRKSDYDKSTGKYIFSISELNQSNCVHDYKETTVDPTYLKKGYTIFQCEKCGDTYKGNYVAKLKLGQSSIDTYYSYTEKRVIRLRWSTVSDASGYQVRWCRKKAMKKNVKSGKLKGQDTYSGVISHLSRKKNYYVQVRAYKKIGKKVVYGDWSEKVKFRTK